MKVEIDILNYNGKNLLELCLPSILRAAKNSIYKPKIVVVDNNSSDRSADFVKNNFPEVSFMQLPENKVLCAFNDAAKSSEADIMIFLNNDLKVDENFIDPLIEVFKKRDNMFLAAARVCNFDGNEIEDGRNIPLIKWGIIKGICKFKGYERDLDEPSFTFMAGFGAFDRKKFLELGGYDSLYLPGIMEDMDICFRAWRRGFRSIYQPKSLIYHMGKTSFTKRFGNRKLLAISHRNTYFFIWKNINDAGILFKNIFFAPLRLIYALLSLKWEIVWGFFWFLLKFPSVIKSRFIESSKQKDYLVSDKQLFLFFKRKLWNSKNIEKLIGDRFDYLAKTFPSCINETDSRLGAILKNVNPRKGEKILEVGCGKGRVCRVIKNLGADIYGMDISEKLLTSAKDIEPFHFMKAEAYKIPFKDNTFDAVILLEVAEHIPSLQIALKEFERVLKAEGKLVIVDRNKFSLNNRRFLVPNLIIKRYHELKNEWMYPRDFPYREIWFNPWGLARKLKDNFYEVKYEYIVSDGERNKWWHMIFKILPQARHFVLWQAIGKNTVGSNAQSSLKPKAVLKEFGTNFVWGVEKVAKNPSLCLEAASKNVLSSRFCLRIDADEYYKESFACFYPLFEKTNKALTIFFNVNSFQYVQEHILRCKELGLDIQSHAYFHHTYNEYFSNRYNIKRAKNFFERIGIKTKGFAAPMGKWNWALMQALEAEGYEYSSDFSYDYLSLPSFPSYKRRTSKILEIPIFPVAPELFFQNKLFSQNDILAYYKDAIDEMIRLNLPVIIYAHTSTYGQQVVDLLNQITEYALKDKNLAPINMTSICKLWKDNAGVGLGSSLDYEFMDSGYLGREVNLPSILRLKKRAREMLEPERINLIKDFVSFK
jgi:GT2 family glycosyltransferase/ubiquinone/menaquinone biosynthesis C-methylase UbiE